MDVNERIKLLEFFDKIEKDYKVENWSVQRIDIWPIVKEHLFFSIYRKPIWKNYLKSYLDFFLQKRNMWQKKKRPIMLNKREVLFSSGSTVRLSFNEKSYNKFFDPMMDYLESKTYNPLLIEYHSIKNKNYYKSERIFDANVYLEILKNIDVKKQDLIKLESFEEFIKEISQFDIDVNFFIKRLQHKIRNVIAWRNLYKEILIQTTPKAIFLICYYCEPSFGLICAAKELKITTTDMQHGAQGRLHFAYNYKPRLFSLNSLPTYFWVWDIASYKDLLSCFEEDKILLGGNPWISINDEVEIDLLSKDELLILYSLQTTVKPYVPDFLIEAIKGSPGNYKWWFRLHPRMKKGEIEEIHKLLKDQSIFDNIEILKSTKLPLPAILKNTSVHISAYSGSLGEAALLSVPINITYSLVGAETYNELILDNKLFYKPFNKGEELLDFIKMNMSKIVNKDSCTLQDKPHFKSKLDELI